MSDIEYVAARYASSLADIIAVLGPEGICGCDHPSDCGLPFEAEEALKIAKGALAGHNAPDESISPEMRALVAAEASNHLAHELQRNLTDLNNLNQTGPA